MFAGRHTRFDASAASEFGNLDFHHRAAVDRESPSRRPQHESLAAGDLAECVEQHGDLLRVRSDPAVDVYAAMVGPDPCLEYRPEVVGVISQCVDEARAPCPAVTVGLDAAQGLSTVVAAVWIRRAGEAGRVLVSFAADAFGHVNPRSTTSLPTHGRAGR